MSDRILDNNNFEDLKLYEDDSLIHKEVTPLMRRIFSRLFQGTEANIDDFHFCVFEDQSPNAFFIPKDKTLKKEQNIIAISRGLLDTCNNESELAGIIGHECGHYLWSEILGGDNTIFQERVSDLRAVDLMINGGYNPIHHLNVCSRVFNYGDYDSQRFLDVHGHSLSRVEDIKAKLTLIANEKGDFPKIDEKPDKAYLQVRQKAHKAYELEGYDTYLEKCLIKSYGHKDITKLSAEQVMRVIYDELEAGNLDIKVRTFEVYHLTEQLHKAKKFDDKSPELTELCQNVFMKMKDNSFLSYNQSMLTFFQLKPFGIFAEQLENIEKFDKSTSKEEALFYARQIDKLSSTLDYLTCFQDTKPSIFQPQEEKNIGKMLPHQQFKKWAVEITDGEDRLFFNQVLDQLDQFRFRYSQNLYFCDKNEIVIAFGKEAERLHLQEQKNIDSQIFLHVCKENKESFDQAMDFHDKLAQFSMTTDEKEKFALATELSAFMIHEYATIVYSTGTTRNPKYLRDPYIKECYERFNNSLTKKYFVDGMDADSHQIYRLERYAERKNEEEIAQKTITDENSKKKYLATLDDKDMAFEITSRTNPWRCREFKDKVFHSLVELGDYIRPFQKGNSTNFYTMASRLINLKFSEPNYRNMVYVFKDLGEDLKQTIDDLKEKFDFSSRAQIQVLQRRGLRIGDTVEDFKLREESIVLKYAMRQAGFDYHADMNATLNRYDEISTSGDYEKARQSKNFWDYNAILVATNAIRDGKDFDLKRMMKSLANCSSPSESSPIIPDIFAEAIKKRNKFLPLELKDKIYVYEVMENLHLFSERYANKTEFFRAIVHDIEKNPNRNEALEIAEKLLSRQFSEELDRDGLRKPHEIEFSKEKDSLIRFYAKGKADLLGIDDGSDAYYEKASKLAQEISSPLQYGHYSSEKFSRGTLHDILEQISTNVVSQELTAQMLSEKSDAKFSQQDAQQFDEAARLAESVIHALSKSPETAKVVIDFLSKKCTQDSINEVFDKLSSDSYTLHRGDSVSNSSIKLDTFSLELLHDNFWHADLPVRAYLMNKILTAYSKNDKDILNLVVDMNFDQKSPYYKEAKRVVKAVFDHLKPYERNLVLAALVSANQKDKNTTRADGEAVGEGLRMFFENKGPAFVKFGQLLSYLPVLDSDIRKPLAKLRDKADIPTRADVFKLMKETLPNEELAKIGRVDEILGAGSFFITAKIEYEDKPCVVALMRPYAKDLAQSGMDMIYDTITDLSQQDSMYKPLLNIANQARLSAMSETDIEADYKKFVEAVKIYDDVKITTPQGEYTPCVAKWISYGKGKEDQVYKIMSMAEGSSMTSSLMSLQTKHDMAVAYVALELSNLLAGGKWDTDRHQGQQNLAEDGFKKFIIGIFDTGAQIQNSPKFKDKVLLGGLLYGMIRAARNGDNIADYMIKRVKKIDKAGDILNFDTLYIDEVQRGLTALSDIITYQKEIKDKDGTIIQPEKSLTSQEIGEIAAAIMNSGLVDKQIKMTIAAKALLNKVQITRKGWIKSLSEGLKKISSSIKIEKQDKVHSFEARHIDKPQKEIEALTYEDQQKRVLGVNLKHINRSKEKTMPQQYTAAAFCSR